MEQAIEKSHKGFKELEKVFWERTWEARKKFNIVGKIFFYPILVLVTGFFHYAFAAMHNTTILFKKKQ